MIAKAYVEYFSNEKHVEELRKLLEELDIPAEEVNTQAQIFENMNFVITGSVEHFANRNEVKAVIESKGGKVTGSVIMMLHPHLPKIKKQKNLVSRLSRKQSSWR